MSTHEELESLREEVRRWLQNGAALSQRIDRLEQEVLGQMAQPGAEHAAHAMDAPEAAAISDVAPAARTAATPPPLPKTAPAPSAAAPDAPQTPVRAPMPLVSGRECWQARQVRTPSPMPLVPAGPSLWTRARAWLQQFGPEEDLDWEMKLWWWLARVGIVVLVMGVVGLMAYAIEQFGAAWWMPYFRLALGYACCGVLLYFGKRFETHYRSYARVLLSGGIALSYFVTFATHYVPYTQVLSRPEPALLLLTAVVLAWGIVAQVRRSWMVAAAVTALGHFTVLMSTLSLETPSRFAVVGLVALSVMSAFFLLRHGWFLVAVLGMAGSYLNHFFWLAKAPGSDAPLDFVVAMAVLALYHTTFAAADYGAARLGTHRERTPARLRTAYTAFNTGAVFFLGMALMTGFDFTRESLHLFHFTFAGVLAVYGLMYWQRRAGDALLNVYFTKAAAIGTLGLAAYFDGATLTAALAVESVVLLMAARRSGLVVTRLLAHAVGVLATLHGLWFLLHQPWFEVHRSDPGFAGMAVSSGVTVLALLAGSLLYQRTDWTRRAPATLPWGDAWLARLWQLDLIGEAPMPGLRKPLDGLLYPYRYAYAATLLGLLYTWLLVQPPYLGPALIGMALALSALGVVLGSRPFVFSALLWSLGGLPAAGSCSLFGLFMHGSASRYQAAQFPAHLLCAVLALGGLLLLSELARRAEIQFRARGLRALSLPDLHIVCAFVVYFTAAAGLLETQHQILGMALGAAAAAGFALAVPAPAFALLALLLSVAGGLLVWTASLEMAGAILPALLLLAVPAFLSDRRYFGTRPGLQRLQGAIPPYVLYFVLTWVYGIHSEAAAPHFLGWLTGHEGLRVLYAGTVGTLVFLALCRWLHLGACSLAAVFQLFGAYMGWAGMPTPLPLIWHAGALGVVAVALAGERWVWLQAVQSNAPRYRAGDQEITLGALLSGGQLQRIALQVIAAMMIFQYAEHLTGEWLLAVCLLLAFLWAGWALVVRTTTAAILSGMFAGFGTAGVIISAYASTLQTGPMAVAFVAAAVYWCGVERVFHARATRLKQARWLQPMLVAAPCALLLMVLERVPMLDRYVTVSWTLAAVLVLGLGLVFGERRYRFASIAVFLLALGHVLLVDMKALPPLFRVLALMVLGAVLLAVAFGYTRQRHTGGGKDRKTPKTPEDHENTAESAPPDGGETS